MTTHRAVVDATTSRRAHLLRATRQPHDVSLGQRADRQLSCAATPTKSRSRRRRVDDDDDRTREIVAWSCGNGRNFPDPRAQPTGGEEGRVAVTHEKNERKKNAHTEHTKPLPPLPDRQRGEKRPGIRGGVQDDDATTVRRRIFGGGGKAP